MFRLLVVSCLLVAAIAAPRPAVRRSLPRVRNIFPNGKIVGGSQVGIEKVPWQVALEDTGYLFCGGSIISANYILTAAHCTDGTPAEYISVRSGTSKLESGGTVTDVESLAQNPGFDFFELDFDVSVLKLAKPLNLTGNQQAIVLRTAEAEAGETAQVSGWGTLHEGDFDLPSNLQAVEVPVLSREDCNAAYEDAGGITERMICAGVTGKDSCQGDSGGAIAVNNQQVGIVSWGYGCAEAGYPGVYSNVANLKDFIVENSNDEATWA